MIRNRDNQTIAYLANDSVCVWKNNRASQNTNNEAIPSSKPAVICEAARIAVTCRQTSAYAILTQKGRVLTGFENYSMEDITDLIPLASREELLGCSTEILLSAQSPSTVCTVAIKTQTCISFVDIGSLWVCYLGTQNIPSGIDIFGFDAWHAVVKTNSNDLHLIKIGIRDIISQQLCRSGIENIQQIVCTNNHIFLLKQNKVVSERPIGNSMTEQIDIFNREPVSKIIADGQHVFFITTKSMCYYFHYKVCRYEVSLIEVLKERYIENIFVLKERVVFQYDGDRLCFLHLVNDIYRHSFKQIDPPHMVQFVPAIPLLLCENMGIISIESVGKHTVFVTDEGRAFSALTQYLETQHLTEIPFFVDNPLMVRNRAIAIKSAGSDPRDA